MRPASRPTPVPRARRRASSSSHRTAGEALTLEQFGAQADAVVGQLFGEPGPDASRLQLAQEPTAIVDAHTEVEQEDVLQRDDVTLHALHLGDVGDAPGTVPHAG